ncbi:MAG: hypothetical protein US49_C0001G0138 [candidate division TM6 bacterium GW2011_GWF2_37_49]|nr:MAG: hypothetical protein US49_C0001G0138 [candidate division TM6 bacterium GW2011_GWF2_37_49]
MFKRFLFLITLSLSTQIGQICAMQATTAEQAAATEQATTTEHREDEQKNPATSSKRLQKNKKDTASSSVLKSALLIGGVAVAGAGAFLIGSRFLGHGSVSSRVDRLSSERVDGLRSEDESFHDSPAIWNHEALKAASLKTDDQCNRMANALWAAAVGDALGALQTFKDINPAKITWFMPNIEIDQPVYKYSQYTTMTHIVFEVLADRNILPDKKVGEIGQRFNHHLLNLDASKIKPTDCESVVSAWPIGFFYSNIPQIAIDAIVNYSQITNNDVTAVAACAAMTAGFVYLCNNPKATKDQVANAMIGAARVFDELQVGSGFQYIDNWSTLSVNDLRAYITRNNMLTSQMLLYAKGSGEHSGSDGWTPQDVLGDDDATNEFNRSRSGRLVGRRADEALAAALYIFMRYADKPTNQVGPVYEAIFEALYVIGGNSSGIATLVGALMGYRYDGDLCRDMQEFYKQDSTRLEWERHIHAIYAQ